MLVHFVPRIGLEFLDFPIVITDQVNYMNTLLADEVNHSYVLTSFNRCIKEFNFDINSLNAIGTTVILNARSINNVFSYFLDISICRATDKINAAF